LKEEILKEVICSFLNTNGGILILGVKDNNKEVSGIRLTMKERDELRLIVQKLANSIKP
jgi:predicted HTH transcriptional regulator